MRFSSQVFIALIIGNSRLHWGYFQDRKLLKSWNTNHLEEAITDLPTALFPKEIAGNGISRASGHQFLPNNIPIYIASVVTKQTQLWEPYPNKRIITLDDIPLRNTYSTFGIDRALCVYGAGETYGYPVLVVDGGTALTYTALGKERNFLGGAILPGLQLQLRALTQNTDALPGVSLPDRLPELWGNETKSAIASGVIHTIISGLDNYLTCWWKQFPDSKVILTGGDGRLLEQFLKEKSPIFANQTLFDPTLMFQGITKLIQLLEL